MEKSETWVIEEGATTGEAVLRHTGKDTSLPRPPKFKFSRSPYSGSIHVQQVETGAWNEEQQALALRPLVYLLRTTLRPLVKKITIQ